MTKIDSCRVCHSKHLEMFFDLGDQALANSLLSDQSQNEESYPLALNWCKDCNLVQLGYTVDPKILFSNYVWVTSTSKTAQEFSQLFYQELSSRISSVNDDSYTLEIASNDGTFLIPFKKAGHKVLGVDPAKNIADMANQVGIPTVVEFWGDEYARQLLSEKGPAQIVFARNVLPHVANTHDFVSGLRTVLSDDGVLAIEVHYAKIILEGLHYDSIYHEHLCYFTLKSLEELLNKHGLYIFDMMASPISGGSIIVYAQKTKVPETTIVQEYRDAETEQEINELRTWKNFAEQSFLHKKQLLEIVEKTKQQGLLAGYGASARSSTMLNFCGIGSNIIDVIADQNPLKQGQFTAGTHISIVSPEDMVARNPQSIIILGWNFADEIMNILEDKFNYKGSYIIPLPGSPKLLSSRTYDQSFK